MSSDRGQFFIPNRQWLSNNRVLCLHKIELEYFIYTPKQFYMDINTIMFKIYSNVNVSRAYRNDIKSDVNILRPPVFDYIRFYV